MRVRPVAGRQCGIRTNNSKVFAWSESLRPWTLRLAGPLTKGALPS